MPDHWHAVILPRQTATISDAIKAIKERSTYEIGLQRGDTRRLWQPRFYDRVLRTVKEYRDTLGYIHMNPVTCGLVERPEEWAWSSFSVYEEGDEGALPLDIPDLPLDENARLV